MRRPECAAGMCLNLSASNCPLEFPSPGSCGELGHKFYSRHGGRNSQPVTSALHFQFSSEFINLLIDSEEAVGFVFFFFFSEALSKLVGH